MICHINFSYGCYFNRCTRISRKQCIPGKNVLNKGCKGREGHLTVIFIYNFYDVLHLQIDQDESSILFHFLNKKRGSYLKSRLDHEMIFTSKSVSKLFSIVKFLPYPIPHKYKNGGVIFKILI